MTFARPRAALIAVVALAMVLAPHPAEAQLGGLGRRIKQKAEERIDQRTEEAAEAAVDQVDRMASGTRTVWANYDFIPGQRTIFYSDFTDEEVGNFPRRLTFKSGSMEVVELDGQRALKASSASGFVVPIPEVMPVKFTIEIDVINRNSQGVAAPTIKIYGGTALKTDVDDERTRIAYGHNGWGVDGGGTVSTGDFTPLERDAHEGQRVSVRVLGDGAYLKLYADGRRLANVPDANFMRGKGIYVAMEARDGDANAVYVTRIRIAESEKTVYEALSATGRWATQGILFDIGKSRVRPESAPALDAIATALAQQPDLRIRIEGHTDNVGAGDANLQLSEARAAAVKAALVKDHAIDPARVETAGLGDARPVGDNATAEGRSSNRRVEVVKL